MEITKWSVKKDDGSVSFNHIEDGWVDGDYPKPLKQEFTNQTAWKNMKWIKEYVHLINGKVKH